MACTILRRRFLNVRFSPLLGASGAGRFQSICENICTQLQTRCLEPLASELDPTSPDAYPHRLRGFRKGLNDTGMSGARRIRPGLRRRHRRAAIFQRGADSLLS